MSDSDSIESAEYYDSSSSSSDEEEEQVSHRQKRQRSSSDNSEPEEIDDKIPISERLKSNEKKKEQQGIDKEERKQRRAQALQLIRERLSTESQTRKSKHAPTEASSKKEDFYRQQQRNTLTGVGVELNAHRYKPRDPRMSSMSGRFDEEQFEKNYEFLQEKRDEEIALLKKTIAARKVTGKKGQKLRKRLNITQEGSIEEDREEMKRLQQEMAQVERNQVERSAKRAVKKKIQEEVADGKRGAYFLKRKERKRLETEAKFDEIRKRGGDRAVQKIVAKKRKKNKSRDAAKLQL